MYIKRLLIVIVITCGLSYAAGLWLDHIYKKKWSKVFFNKTDALLKDNTYYDVVFLGDSRVNWGINPYYIDSVTKLNTYNFGYGNADMEHIMMTTGIFLEHHPPPKLVFLSLDMGNMSKGETFNSSYYLLYYLQNDSISKYMNRAGYLTTLMKVFPFTKYCFFDEYDRTSLFTKGKPIPAFRHNAYKGFLNVFPDLNNDTIDLTAMKRLNLSLWPPAIMQTRNIVSSLLRKGITVIMVYPPERSTSIYRGTELRRAADSIYNVIANEYHLKYLHFENDPKYRDNYFTDDVHLNEPGAKMYSLQLADSINRYLSK